MSDKSFMAIPLPSRIREMHYTPMGKLSDEVVEKTIDEVRAVIDAKDGAYKERDMLLSLLTKAINCNCWLERHPANDTTWEDDWRWIVFIKLPTGQASWHIHDSELPWFDHLQRFDDHTWDGHTTEEKYERVLAVDEAFVAPDWAQDEHEIKPRPTREQLQNLADVLHKDQTSSVEAVE